MPKFLLSFVAATLLAVNVLPLRADVYTISCSAREGYVGLGSWHDATPYIYYVPQTEVGEDGYWEVEQAAVGSTFRNRATGQYLSFTTERNGNIVKYMTLTDAVTSDNERWTIEEQGDGSVVIRSVADNSYVWDLRLDGTNLIGGYQGSGTGANERFYLTSAATPREQLEAFIARYLPDGVTDTLFPVGTDEGEYTESSVEALRTAYNKATALLAEGGSDVAYTEALQTLRTAFEGLKKNTSSTSIPQAWHVYLADGRVEAYPVKYVISRKEEDGELKIETNVGIVAGYPMWQVDSVSLTPPQMPNFRTFKFNNKYNDQLFTDCQGVITGDAVRLTVGAIGKRLTPSFTFTSPRAVAYVDGEEQYNHKTRRRFEGDVVYLVADGGVRILQRAMTSSGDYEYVMRPYGRFVTVTTDWLTDHATEVPAVYIETNDGDIIRSKTVYKDAFIHIDGKGVFPDFPLTAVQVKGRGNTSWSTPGGTNDPKNPYRLKFEEKQKPFGMTKGKSWVLLANKQTNSMLTNAIGHRIANLVGAAAANHVVPVDLYINNEYRGSYNFTEKVGLGNNSIDLEDESHAALLELDSYYDETYKFKSAMFNLPVNIKQPDFSDPTEVTLTSMESIENRFNAMEEAVARGTDIDRYLDIDYLCRFLVANELMKNNELAHPKSTFLYIENVDDDESKFVFGPVWDCDWAYGYGNSHNYFVIEQNSDFYQSLANGYVGTNFFQTLRRQETKLGKNYYKVWSDFMEQGLDELVEYVQDYYDYARPSLERNALKWSDGRNYETTASNARNWLRGRAETLFGQLTTYDISDLCEPPLQQGDANEDGDVTLADAVCVVNAMLERENEHFNFHLADIDGNGLLTAGDLAAVLSMVLNDDKVAATRRTRILHADATLGIEDATATRNGTASLPISLQIDNGSFTALHFTLKLPSGVSLIDIKLPDELVEHKIRIVRCGEGHYRVFLFSDENAPLPLGSTELQMNLAVSNTFCQAAQVRLCTAYLVTNDGEDRRTNTATSTIVSTVSAVAAPNADIRANTNAYDLQGRRVAKVERGIYIVGGKKVIR